MHSLVIGLGKTGWSCINFLIKQGQSVLVADTREQPPYFPQLQQQYPDIRVYLTELPLECLEMVDQIVVSPGVSLCHPWLQSALELNKPIVGDVELFAQSISSTQKVIAITGSNGKSTVTSLVGEILQQTDLKVKVGGNLGTPVLDLIATDIDVYVLELSSFQLETTHCLNPMVSVILNLSPDHLDRYPDLSAYQQAKQRIYYGDGVIVANKQQALLLTQLPQRSTIYFGLEPPEEGEWGIKSDYLMYGVQPILSTKQLKLAGQYNLENVLAACALVTPLNIPFTAIQQGLSVFTGLPHRMQWVAEKNGVTWYNDSKSTNVGSAIAGLSGFEQRIIWIAGGQGKGMDFTPLSEVVSKQVKVALLLGEMADTLAELLAKDTTVIKVRNMEQAVITANQFSEQGDIVLLSPACASFDQYQNFMQRGEDFINQVKKL